MQDTRRKIGSKMHGQKLMINWELKKVIALCYEKILPYFMPSFWHEKQKQQKLASSHFILHLSLLFLSFLNLCSEFGVATNSFLSVNTSHKIRRQT